MLSGIKKRLPTANSLGGRALRAGGWNLVKLLVLNILRLSSNLIMTRLLLPDAFALLSFVFIMITALNLATDVGIRQSIIRDEDGESDDFLRTAWVLKIARGLLIAGLLIVAAIALGVSAPYWAPNDTVYADPRLPGLIVLGALVPLLMGLQSTTRELAERRLLIRPWAILEISAQALSIVFMVVFAQISATVWALMAGSLMAFLLKAVGSHIFLPGPRMHWHFSTDIAWRIWGFGKWLIGSSIFTFVGQNADKLIFGALLDITTMGLLTVAYVWLTAGQRIIWQLVHRVAYPVLSEIKRDRAQELPRLLKRVQRIIDLLCVVGFAGAAFLGPWMVTLLYTETYHLSGPILALLGLSLLCLRFEVLNNLLLTYGDSRGMMWLWAQRAGFLILCLQPVYNAFGLTAALAVTALHSLVSVPYVLFRLRDHVDRRTVLDSAAWIVIILALGYVMTRLTSLS